jgi:hypothetical protein
MKKFGTSIFSFGVHQSLFDILRFIRLGRVRF